MINTIINGFQGKGVSGKIQHGAAWWHLNNYNGIIGQLTNIKNLSMLPYFVGMLTDSRNYMSFARHDYFRQILAEFLASTSELEDFTDEKILEGLMADICYNNAERFFSRIR